MWRVLWEVRKVFFSCTLSIGSSVNLARPAVCAGCLFGSIYFIDRSVVSFRYVESGIANVKWFILVFYYVGTAIQRRKNWPEFRIGKTAQDGCSTEFGHWLLCELVLHFEVVAYDWHNPCRLVMILMLKLCLIVVWSLVLWIYRNFMLNWRY